MGKLKLMYDEVVRLREENNKLRIANDLLNRQIESDLKFSLLAAEKAGNEVKTRFKYLGV